MIHKKLIFNKRRFQRFGKLSNADKMDQLRLYGILLDSDTFSGEKVNYYYLNGFLVEETRNLGDNKLVSILPFDHEYLMQNIPARINHEKLISFDW